jgi:hypothetical protein
MVQMMQLPELPADGCSVLYASCGPRIDYSCKEMRLQQSAASDFRDDRSMVVARFFMTMEGARVSAAEI